MLFNAAALALVVAVLSVAPVRLAEAQEQRAEPEGGEPGLSLLVFGDSLAAGYGLASEQSFPVQLEAALRGAGYAVDVINAGVSGDTTAAGLARLDWALAGVPAGGPDAVIVELGGNDALRGLDPATAYANLDKILTRLAERGIPVLLAGMWAPPNLGGDYGRAFREVYTRLASEHDVVFYPFFLDGVAADPSLNQADGIHPNGQGVAVIVERILPSVKELLAKIARESATREHPGRGLS